MSTKQPMLYEHQWVIGHPDRSMFFLANLSDNAYLQWHGGEVSTIRGHVWAGILEGMERGLSGE